MSKKKAVQPVTITILAVCLNLWENFPACINSEKKSGSLVHYTAKVSDQNTQT